MQRPQHDKNGSPDAEADFPNENGKQQHIAMRYVRSTLIVAACVFVACILWCLEPWQRPEFTRKLPDAILLWTACLGLLGFSVMVALQLKTAHRWRWMLALCVCGFALLGGMRLFFGKLALSNLENQIDKKIPALKASSGIPSTSMSEKLVGILESLHLGVPDWLSKHAQQQYQSIITPTPESVVAYSRWPLRRALADSMVRNDSRAEFLLQNWRKYFPAITGVDVSLKIRREWISQLDALRREVSLGDSSRQAAILCMALIVLTDPPEFENWRVPVRDAMLACGNPLEPAVWMRTIDTLLALDPPESWGYLSEPLTSNHDLFRYAMAVPVRGLATHFDALSSEFEFFDFQPASDLWHGAGASLEAWPDIFGKSETAKIRNWLRDAQFHRLMNYGNYTLDKIGNTNTRVWLGFTPEQQLQLAATATGWARLASEEIVSASAREKSTILERLASIRRIHPYLTKNQQTELGRLLIPVMLRPDFFHRSDPINSIRFYSNWVELLCKIQPLMTADERKNLQTALIPLMGNLDPKERTSAVLLCMDAWSDMSALSAEKWLALAWHVKCGWKIVPRNTPREQIDPLGDAPLPVPPVDEHAVESLAKHLDAAISTEDESFFTGTLERVLNEDSQTSTRSPTITYFSYRQIMNWKTSGILGPHSLKELLKMELYLKGLHELNDHEMRILKSFARRNLLSFEWRDLLYRTGTSDNPWSDALQDPQSAAQEIARLINERNYIGLNGLLCSAEKFPPEKRVVRAIWDALMQKSKNSNIRNKTEIFGALFQLSHLLPPDERMAMRRDFHTVVYTKEIRSWDFYEGSNVDDNPLHYLGGGMGIPWEDDELSAELSWSSNFERLTCYKPTEPTDMHTNSTFRFLELGVLPRHEINPRDGSFELIRMRPLTAPFEPTPWQKARELHLRHPDLDIK